MPGGVFQRRIHIRPRAGVIHQDHQTDRGPAEYIEGIKALVQDKRFRRGKVINLWIGLAMGVVGGYTCIAANLMLNVYS